MARHQLQGHGVAGAPAIVVIWAERPLMAGWKGGNKSGASLDRGIAAPAIHRASEAGKVLFNRARRAVPFGGLLDKGNELLEEHCQGVGNVGSFVPVGVDAAIDRRDRDRRVQDATTSGRWISSKAKWRLPPYPWRQKHRGFRGTRGMEMDQPTKRPMWVLFRSP